MISERFKSKISDKISELETRLIPETKYNINNQKYLHRNYDVVETCAKIDTLKWLIGKKRKL